MEISPRLITYLFTKNKYILKILKEIITNSNNLNLIETDLSHGYHFFQPNLHSISNFQNFLINDNQYLHISPKYTSFVS